MTLLAFLFQISGPFVHIFIWNILLLVEVQFNKQTRVEKEMRKEEACGSTLYGYFIRANIELSGLVDNERK